MTFANSERIERWLRRFGAVTVALASVCIIAFAWGSLIPEPTVNDERSYLLQAEIFANGHWAAPSPPIAEFFEQPHVLVVPALASKYPPGHALLLSIGVLFHYRPLVPLLATAITAAFLFILSSRFGNPFVAVLAWSIWISTPLVLRFQASYFSEVTTGSLLLVSWYCLLEWRATRRRLWLLVLTLLVSWGGITRPLTMLALGLPIGVLVFADLVRARRLIDLGSAFAVLGLVMAIVPLWSARTTGNWKLTPLALYRRDYMPYDKLGFRVDTTPPQLSLQPPTQRIYEANLRHHRLQNAAALPHTAEQRAQAWGLATFGGVRRPLALMALIGVVTATAPIGFAGASALLVFVAYLAYAYNATWTLYFLELAPVIAAIAAMGTWRVVGLLFETLERARFVMLLVSTLCLFVASPVVVQRHRDAHSQTDGNVSVRLNIKAGERALVFISYSESGQHVTAVSNHADLESTPVWVVHDLGPRNAELQSLAPDRVVYRIHESALLHETGSRARSHR